MPSVPTTDVPTAIGVSTGMVADNAIVAGKILRLEQGDHLSRLEFERRYKAMPEVKKAELIEGAVYMPSPVRFPEHGRPQWFLIGSLFAYESNTPGVMGGDNSSVVLDNDNMPQPDALLMIKPECGGQASIGSTGYIEGAPELVAEIASSSVSIDLHDKLNVYRRSGVREYIVWRVLDWTIDWFVLRNGQYVPLALDEQGIIHSEAFPGLWLNLRGMLELNVSMVEATLQQGIATPEHQEFVARLATQSKTGQENK